jgi:NitT/TauT family transport system substrate-binding protein
VYVEPYAARIRTYATVPSLIAAILLLFTTTSWAEQDLPAVRVGVLKFGTVNWELDTIKRHGLDHAEGFDLKVVELGGKDATAVALQGRSVDIIVTDWLWVSRQRSEGSDFTFVSHSLATGGLIVRPDAGIRAIADLRGRKLGIAGGPVDKSWLLLQAYVKKKLGEELSKMVDPTFGAPPLLNELTLRGDLPATLTFWHYGARLKAAGMAEIVSAADMLPELGVETTPPLLGWVFSEKWANDNRDAVLGFLRASLAAKQLLKTSDEEWVSLRKLMKAEDDATFDALRRDYRAGIPTSFTSRDIAAAGKLFETLAALGGEKLVGKSGSLAAGTFWVGFAF